MNVLGANLNMVSANVVVVVFLIMILAGFIKGTLGFGLPLVALSLLGNVIDIRLALALLTLPIVFSNFWLGVQGGNFGSALRRFWVVIVAVAIGIFLGSRVLVGLDSHVLMFVVGSSILVFTLADRFATSSGLIIRAHAERRWGAAVGIIAGLIGGVSATYGPPLVMYLTALHLPKDIYIASIGVIWFFASIALLIAFSTVHILTPHTATLSALSVIPVLIGMTIGRRVRGFIPQLLFRRLTLIALVALAANLLRRAWFA